MLLNSYYLMKKIRKIRTIFDVENWLWKSNFGTFWHLLITPISINSFDYSWFFAKTFLILYPSLENSTTGIAIVQVNQAIINENLKNYLRYCAITLLILLCFHDEIFELVQKFCSKSCQGFVVFFLPISDIKWNPRSDLRIGSE